MDLNSIEIKEMFQVVENLMSLSQISIRDTWKGVDGFNYDDYFINNGYGGKKHFKVIIKEDGFTDTFGGKTYVIPGFKFLAYDNFSVRVPKRLIGKRHNIIHEIVHFLQENTSNEEGNYISFNGSNYKEYISQRVENEAHFVQLLYISLYELNEIELENSIRNEFLTLVKESINNLEKRPYLILFSKHWQII